MNDVRNDVDTAELEDVPPAHSDQLRLSAIRLRKVAG
jgi:hypothetical protein